LNPRQLGPAVLFAAACGLAAAASFTHPFTLAADVVTGIALVAMLVAQGVAFFVGRRRRLAAGSTEAAGPASPASPAGPAGPAGSESKPHDTPGGLELVATYGDFDEATRLDAPTAWRMILILQAVPVS
jgi:hypothetical protein